MNKNLKSINNWWNWFLGTNLCSFLNKKKYKVISLSRNKPSSKKKIKKVKYLQIYI